MTQTRKKRSTAATAKARAAAAKKRPTKGQFDAVAKRALRNADGEHLLCRTFMHAWRVPDDDDELFAQAPFGVTVATICTRCGAQRIDGVSRFTGDLITRRYVMPSDYLIKGAGDHGVSRKLARVEFIRRRAPRAK